MAEQSLKDKTVKGTFWSAADAFLGQGITFFVGLVLARLLSPEEYGLIGIVMIFTGIMSGIVDCGFSNSLIRKKEISNEDYSTLFYVNLVISVLLFFLLFIGAPWIALFFGRPELVPLVRVMGSILIIQALTIVQSTILSRRIDFKTKTKASVISAVISGVIGIVMAFSGYGVWSLVAQLISRQAIYSICLWWFNKWYPDKAFSISSLRYMWGFGWKLLLSSMLENIWKELNQFVVGKFYNPATLGQYSRSNDYARIFSSNVTSIVQRVTYPVLAQVQDDKERMVYAYRKVIKTTVFVSAIGMISMGAIAEPLIFCLIGPQWSDAAKYLPYICVTMSLYPLHAINLNMLQVQGRTDIYLYLEIIKKLIALLPVFLGIFVGIYSMLIGGIFIGLISFFLNSHYTGKKLGYSSWMQLKDIAPSYGIAIIVAVSVYFFKYLPLSNLVILLIQLVIGVIVFFVICKKTHSEEYIELKRIFLQLVSNINHK